MTAGILQDINDDDRNAPGLRDRRGTVTELHQDRNIQDFSGSISF